MTASAPKNKPVAKDANKPTAEEKEALAQWQKESDDYARKMAAEDQPEKGKKGERAEGQPVDGEPDKFATGGATFDEKEDWRRAHPQGDPAYRTAERHGDENNLLGDGATRDTPERRLELEKKHAEKLPEGMRPSEEEIKRAMNRPMDRPVGTPQHDTGRGPVDDESRYPKGPFPEAKGDKGEKGKGQDKDGPTDDGRQSEKPGAKP